MINEGHQRAVISGESRLWAAERCISVSTGRMSALAAVAQAHALACPPWCALPPDHDLESQEPDGQVFRMHRAYRRCTEDVVLEVVQTATLYAHGAVAVCSPLVRLSESSSVVLTSDQTRELAAALLRTADRLDTLHAPERKIVPAIALG